jgi:hypothetical protein
MAGYHIADIPRGQFGESSKIMEEAFEFNDAIMQGNPVMALCELSDLVGAIKGYLKNKHPSITFDHLIKMQEATSRVHEAGLWVDRSGRNRDDVE